MRGHLVIFLSKMSRKFDLCLTISFEIKFADGARNGAAWRGAWFFSNLRRENFKWSPILWSAIWVLSYGNNTFQVHVTLNSLSYLRLWNYIVQNISRSDSFMQLLLILIAWFYLKIAKIIFIHLYHLLYSWKTRWFWNIVDYI